MKTAPTYIMLLLAAAVTGLMASPSEKRQNDVPDCVEGESASNGPYSDEATCIDQCISKETKEGDPNFGGVCQGNCEGLVIPGPPTITEFTCNL